MTTTDRIVADRRDDRDDTPIFDSMTTAEIFLDDVHDERDVAERTRAKVRAYLARRREKLRRQGGRPD